MSQINYYLGSTETPEPKSKSPVFSVRYGNSSCQRPSCEDNALHLNMSSSLYEIDCTESWWAPSSADITHGVLMNGALRFIELGSDLIVFGKLGTLANLEDDTYASYNAIFDLLSQSGHHRLLRSWNFIPQINEIPAGGIENYQAFCAGRSRAFENHNFQDVEMPAATGIGTQSTELLGYTIATKRPDFRHVENSLQTPAHKYPEQYGPRSPSFARATVLNNFDLRAPSQTGFFLSGTASIRASETIGVNNVELQLDVVMENILHLLKTERAHEPCTGSALTLADFEHFKVYVRHASDIPTIETALIQKWQVERQKLHFMNVDICRNDLLVEIEGCVNSCPTSPPSSARA